VFNLGEGGPQTVEAIFTVTDILGNVIAQSGPIENVDLLLPGRSVFIGTRFFEGTDYHGSLVVGDSVLVTVEIVTRDGTPENNVGERWTTVRN